MSISPDNTLPLSLRVDVEPVKVVQIITYLGFSILLDGTIDHEMSSQIIKAVTGLKKN